MRSRERRRFGWRDATVALVVIAGAWQASACGGGDDGTGSSNAGSTSSGGSGGGATCGNDPRAVDYTAGIEQTGSGGAFKIKILDATPAPPATGNDDWKIELDDASGAPIDGATFEVKPYMPDHGHGSSIKPTVTPAGSGKYDVTMNLFMPGLWQITFNVTSGSSTDSVVFGFCVQG